MRTVCWIAVAAIAMVTATPAEAQHWLWGEQAPGSLHATPECGTPCGGLQPGCCENPPSCCDNVWEGYCQDKARWLAWAEQYHQRRAMAMQSGSSCHGYGEVIVPQGYDPAGAAPEADPYYAGASRRPNPATTSDRAVRLPPVPLTSAVGRRLGYTRPPMRPRH